MPVERVVRGYPNDVPAIQIIEDTKDFPDGDWELEKIELVDDFAGNNQLEEQARIKEIFDRRAKDEIVKGEYFEVPAHYQLIDGIWMDPDKDEWQIDANGNAYMLDQYGNTVYRDYIEPMGA